MQTVLDQTSFVFIHALALMSVIENNFNEEIRLWVLCDCTSHSKGESTDGSIQDCSAFCFNSAKNTLMTLFHSARQCLFVFTDCASQMLNCFHFYSSFHWSINTQRPVFKLVFILTPTVPLYVTKSVHPVVWWYAKCSLWWLEWFELILTPLCI